MSAVPELVRDDARLFYECAGAGDAVVVIHGAAASSISVAPLLEGLRDGYLVVTPDLRGMGRSEPADEVAPSAWVDDLVALLDVLGVERAHVVGVSLGARVALRLALDQPERVESLVLDAPVLEDSAAGSSELTRIFRDDVPAPLAESFARWNGPGWRSSVDRYLRLRLSPGLQEHYTLRARLGEVRARTLVARGDVDDSIHPLEHALEAFRRIERACLWISPNTAFSATRFRPDEAIPLIRRFLDGE